MKTAEERSNYFIWYVIDKIMEKTLPDGPHEVTYYLDVNIRRKELIPFLDERNSLHFLLKNHAIELIDDIGHTENDKKGTPEYVVEEMYRLKLGKKWNEFYDRYNTKVNPPSSVPVKKSWDRSVNRLIESLNGKFEKELVSRLSKKEMTAKELKVIDAKAIRKLISNTNKKIIKQGFKITKSAQVGLDGLRKYKLATS